MLRWGWLLGFLALGGCDWVLRLYEVPTPEPGYRKTIAFEQTFAASLEDVPISVYVANDADLATLAADDAGDIEFVASDGAPLPFEIVDFDRVSGTLDAWVQLPGVLWHIEAGATEAHDRTDNSVHARSASSSSTPAAVAGIVGSGFAFDGVDDHLFTDRADIAAIQPGEQSFSVAAWVYVTTSAGAFDSLLAKGGQTDIYAGYSLALGTGNWVTAISDGAASQVASLGIEVESLGVWTHVASVVDREAKRLLAYRNGNLVSMADITGQGSVNSASLLCLGAALGMSEFMRGILDEARIYRAALPRAMFQLEYANLMMRDRFMIVGPSERREAASGEN